jgi:hypothetical protein
MSQYKIYCAAILLLSIAFTVHTKKPVSPPIWPDEFNTRFLTKVEQYGPVWAQPGRVWYNNNLRALRADYYDWCIPLFDDAPAAINGRWNFTCSFLQTAASETTYFISQQPNPVIKTPCCVFDTPLPPPTPDWLKNTVFNTTELANGVLCDKWYV